MPAQVLSWLVSSALAICLARTFLQEAKAKVQKTLGRAETVGKPQFSVLAPFGLTGHPLSLNTVGERGTSTNPLDDTLPHPVAPSSSHQTEGRSPDCPYA